MRQSSSDAPHHFLSARAAGSSPMKAIERWRRDMSSIFFHAQSGVFGATFTRNFGVVSAHSSITSRMIFETWLNALVPSFLVPPNPAGWFQ